MKIRAAACLATLLSIIAITMPSSPADAAAGAACGASFTKVNIPRLGSRAKVNDVSLVSGDLGWAAANAGGATGSVAAVLRWDGTRWKPVTLPSLATSSNALGVSALSATDAWVVGYVNGTKALTLHWDGVSWTRVMPASVPGSSSVTLQAVDAAAPGDVWAVGSAEVQGATYPITMHWNGAAWSLVDFPSSGDPEWLTGVAAVDGAHAWAVGDTTPGGSSGEIGTWNGGTWVSDFYGLGMNDVTVDATGDVWAVGEAVGSGWIQTWVVHGHAGTWSWGGAVNPYGGAGDFEGVAASDDGPLWAVGTYNETNGQEAALAEVRSGHTWTWVHGPRVSTLDTQFTSVDEAGGRVVAVGYAYYEHEPALIEQICPIRITSGGFAQSAASATLGDSTVWVNTQGAGRHSVADASGIGLFDSGPFGAGRAFSYIFNAAGTYTIADTVGGTPNGSVGIPPTVSKRKGSATDTVTLTWATHAAQNGDLYDVQIQGPGSSAWSGYKTGVTRASIAFTPSAGNGVYAFRARLRSTGGQTDWSPAVTYTVS